MQTRYKSPPIECRFCKQTVFRRNIQRHFTDDCENLPPIPPNHAICTACQSIKLTSDFPCDRSSVRGHDTTCKQCGKESFHIWKKAAREKGIYTGGTSRTPGFHKRPGRWVLKPCEWCAELFRHYDMILHRPRCPKRPPNPSGRKHNFVPIYHVDSGSKETPEMAEQRAILKIKENNLKKYGIFLRDYERMLADQNGCCAICGLPPDPNHPVKNKRVLAVDHCHATNKVRGLLCYVCNHGIGNFTEDPLKLAAAIRYLRRFQKFDMESLIHALRS